MAREQAVAQVQFYPVQYNPVRGEIRLYQRIVSRITWDGAATQASEGRARGSSPAYEELLRKTLANYDRIAKLPTEQTPPEQATVSTGESFSAAPATYLPFLFRQETSSVASRVKIEIVESGLHKLTHS